MAIVDFEEDATGVEPREEEPMQGEEDGSVMVVGGEVEGVEGYGTGRGWEPGEGEMEERTREGRGMGGEVEGEGPKLREGEERTDTGGRGKTLR